MTIPSALEIFFPIRSNVPLRQKKSSSFAFTCLEQHFIWLWKLFRCAGGGTPSQVVLTMWNEIACKASWISFRMKFLSLIITFSSITSVAMDLSPVKPNACYFVGILSESVQSSSVHCSAENPIQPSKLRALSPPCLKLRFLPVSVQGSFAPLGFSQRRHAEVGTPAPLRLGQFLSSHHPVPLLLLPPVWVLPFSLHGLPKGCRRKLGFGCFCYEDWISSMFLLIDVLLVFKRP